MKCKCNEEMVGISCYDDPNKGYAYNLYQCDYCGLICKEDVWKSSGKIWITFEGGVIREQE